MLVRRTLDKEKTKRQSRQKWPEYHIIRTEVMLDPWENNDCGDRIAAAFQVAQLQNYEEWNVVPGSPIAAFMGDQELRRVLEDPDTGYIYYRRPIDIERSQKWNEDRSFRVTAEEW